MTNHSLILSRNPRHNVATSLLKKRGPSSDYYRATRSQISGFNNDISFNRSGYTIFINPSSSEGRCALMINQNIGMRIDSFISYKRSLGYIYDTAERYLKHYQTHMEENFPQLQLPDKESTESFLNNYQGQSGGIYNVSAPLREFSRYLIQIGFNDSYLISSKQMPKQHPEPPYFFAEKEMVQYFKVCDTFFIEKKMPLPRCLVVPMQLLLLYCCGLRPKEARILQVKDVHLPEKYIDVIQSKEPKNRRVYISSELATCLDKYDRAIDGIVPDRRYFFSSSSNNPYSAQFLYYNYDLIWKRAFPNWIGQVPKLYSFRYHFAWTNVNRWCREGRDVNTMLPYMMRYM